MSITLKDIAKRANVSCSAVSHVLNNRTAFVGEETRKRVLNIIRETGYRPHSVARSLRQRTTHTIGLVVARLRSDIHVAQLDSIRRSAWKAGYHVLLGYSEGNIDEERACIEELRCRRVDGMILRTSSELTGTNEHIEELVKDGFALVAVDPVTNVDTDVVTVDRRDGVLRATEHLIGLGHRRIAFLSGRLSFYSTSEKLAGYKMAMKAQGLSVSDELMFVADDFREGDPGYAVGYHLADRIVNAQDRPTAVVAASDELAMGAIKRIREARLKVPNDLAVVGYNNIEGAAFCEVPLTTVAQPATEMGEVASTMLLNKIKSRKRSDATPRRVVLKPELVIRRSCGAKVNMESSKP